MSSIFDNWFEQQHGPRHRRGASGSVVSHSDDELEMTVARGRAAQAELERRQMWDEKRTSALYAWQARKSCMPGKSGDA